MPPPPSDQAGFPSPGGLFAPLAPLLARIPFSPDLAALNHLASTIDLRTHRGLPIAFVRTPDDGLEYEARIWTNGQVATRPGNWHDFFNALVWCTYPRTKAMLNQRHADERSTPAAGRGRARDALTHFDECGAVVAVSDPSLVQLLRGFRWRELFWERRADLRRALRCFVFGHATYEQLLRPFRGLTAKAILYEVTADWLRQPLSAQLADIDRRLSGELAVGRHCDARALQPLPLLGLPGVTADSEDPGYYDDQWQFRPGRGSRRV